MLRSTPSFLLTASILFASGCSQSRGPAPVPRPTAYPRIEIATAEYVPATGTPLEFDVNRTASTVRCDTASNGAVWLTVTYAPGASIYVTFTPVESDAEAVAVAANRYERLSRDLGRAMWSVDALTASADTFTMYTTDEAVPTPAAAIAILPGMVVSGTVALTSPAFIANPDSMAPARDYILEDLWHGFQSLNQWR